LLFIKLEHLLAAFLPNIINGAEALISDWHGQKELSLPGDVKLLRNSGRITLSTNK